MLNYLKIPLCRCLDTLMMTNTKLEKKDILSPALGRPVEQLEDSLLFGSIEECIQKINAFYEAGVKRIHFWPISDFEEQIEIFKKDIACNY